ncbi:MAG TPA: tRNA (N(6)-L-threonylcarbamoyladenosine(37)-C(2))-methylthiotransferase MtaB [Candidatus Enterenecus merdae]|nr:tRNA (N(6)-L-threonylcarbamoyladenosine(37)-C(2))-methylthiotransferase MtaB [Candidatus Enterenecus merdae]
MKVAICTLGCKVNQYESQAMERELLRRGHALAEFDAPADAYIINTCTVTAVSDKKCRNLIRRARKQAPEAVVAVCGCYAQTDPQAVAELGVDLVSGSAGRMDFLDRLEGQLASRGAPVVAVDRAMARREFERLSPGGPAGRTRAMLKVEDGCAYFCTYCIIPYARGPVRSLPMAEAVDQARQLQEAGYRELVLTGIELSSWGRDLAGRPTYLELIEAVCRAVPGMRVRLGSLEPRTVTPEFCRRASALPNLCPHFHLSLQSGCDATLARMRRGYDSKRYEQSIQLLRAAFPDPGITTDLIVGFPQETQEEFDQSLAFVSRCGFSAMHIFPYSPRPGTPAADMDGQVPKPVKEARVQAAAQVADELRQAYLERQVGRTVPVLFEEQRDGLWQGHAPNYVLVRAEGEGLHNQVRSVRLIAADNDGLLGELIP